MHGNASTTADKISSTTSGSRDKLQDDQPAVENLKACHLRVAKKALNYMQISTKALDNFLKSSSSSSCLFGHTYNSNCRVKSCQPSVADRHARIRITSMTILMNHIFTNTRNSP